MRRVNSRFSFTHKEKRDLLKAWIGISLAFTFFFLGGGIFALDDISIIHFATIFILSATTGGIGFLLHELAHKAVAHYFRVEGEFHSNDTMLIVSVVIAMFGLLFAAPGAVYLKGMINRRESGIISAAGPATNMILSVVFLPFALFTSGFLQNIGSIGFLINALLGAFNMLPILNLDGTKIIAWSKTAYFSLLGIAGILVVGAYIVMGMI